MKGEGWRKKHQLVGYITGIWVEREFETLQRTIIKKMLDQVVRYLASNKASALQFVLYDDRYIEDLKSLGFLSQTTHHGIFLPPEHAADDIQEGQGLPRTPFTLPILDAALSLGFHGKTPARMGLSQIYNQWTEIQLMST